MQLKRLVDIFDGVEELPIEISDITREIVNLGIQDEIVVQPQDMDTDELFGVYCRYTISPGVYTPPDLVSLVVYNSNLTVDWQRLVCCKELLHIFDHEVERTDTPEEVIELIEKLLGPMNTESAGSAEFMALRDKMTTYIALGILFPQAARQVAIDELNSGRKTKKQIAEWACLPENLVDLVLGDEWLDILELFVDPLEYDD